MAGGVAGAPLGTVASGPAGGSATVDVDGDADADADALAVGFAVAAAEGLDELAPTRK